MAAKNDNKNSKQGKKEAVFIVKPLVKGYGLDYLHLTLIALVVILVVLAFALTFMKPAVIVQNSNSTYSGNATHNSSQVLAAAEHAITYYKNVNTSLSLLPYYSLVNQSTVSYIPARDYWLVVVPYINPYNSSEIFNFSLIVYDSNLTVEGAFINSVKPKIVPEENVAGLGAISIDTVSACTATKPVPVYLITDPYAPGALPAIQTAINASRMMSGEVNITYYFVFSGYAISKYASYGEPLTQHLGNYLACASKQANFGHFISNLSIAFTGNPPSNYTLSQVAMGSGLNSTSFDACLVNSTQILTYESDLASSYNITSTPEFVVDCKYLTIPQTLGYAVNYSLGK